MNDWIYVIIFPRTMSKIDDYSCTLIDMTNDCTYVIGNICAMNITNDFSCALDLMWCIIGCVVS